MFSNSSRREFQALHARIDSLEKQVDMLATRVAQWPTPPRATWSRKTLPLWETDPSLKLTTILPRATKPLIHRVTICLSGNEQFINSYDRTGHRIAAYSGPFREVGLKVLELAGNKAWEVVAESA